VESVWRPCGDALARVAVVVAVPAVFTGPAEKQKAMRSRRPLPIPST
jgi:hypothetical protein